MGNDEYLYCECGCPVIVHHLKYKGKDFPVFRHADANRLRLISCCPVCGDELKREKLLELGELEIK